MGNNIKLFLARFLGLYLCWAMAYHGFLEAHGRPDGWLTAAVGAAANLTLNLSGFATDVTMVRGGALLSLGGVPLVAVGHPCNGLAMLVLFAVFIVAYQGPVARKLWYVPLGLLAIFAVNVLRVAALAVNQSVSSSTVAFNHKYTFAIVVYLFIFGLWALWANRFAGEVKREGQEG